MQAEASRTELCERKDSGLSTVSTGNRGRCVTNAHLSWDA